ncbi:MAG: hypothetical protein RL161_687 [Bacteroidota bacterium]
MQIAPLNSGSNGNVYYFGKAHESILVDAGLSCKEIEKRFIDLNLDITTVKAIFITHEHSDHIFGLKTFVKKYKTPVYISEKTLKSARLDVPIDLIRFFQSHDQVNIGGFQITAYPTQHDAVDPHGFFISHSGRSAGIFNDIGSACDQVKHYFSKCQAAFLECNYDDLLLENGPYPHHLKERIRGAYGHLSNLDALSLFKNYRSKDLSHLFASHLSAENNDPLKVKELFEKEQTAVQILIAGRKSPGPVIDLELPSRNSKESVGQLSLF